MTKIDYDAEAARLISEWNELSQSDQDFLPRYQGDEEIPVTVFADHTYALGHQDGGAWVTSENDLTPMIYALIYGVEVAEEAARVKAEQDEEWEKYKDVPSDYEDH